MPHAHCVQVRRADFAFSRKGNIQCASPWISGISNCNVITPTKIWKAWKREKPSATSLRYVVVLTLQNHAIIKTALGVRRGKMIHRWDTIAQRTTWNSAIRVRVRLIVHMRSVFSGSPGTFTFSRCREVVFWCKNRSPRVHVETLAFVAVSRDDKQKWETCCACTYLRVLKSEDFIIFFFNKLLSLLGVKTETKSSRSTASS